MTETIDNNPNNLTVHDIAAYVLAQPGYERYDELTRRRLFRSLGSRAACQAVEPPQPPEAA